MPSKLASSIKQTQPFSSLEQEVSLTFFRLATELEHESSSLFKAHGLSMAQYNVLRILRGAGEAGMACGDIGDRLVTKAPDITRLLDRLERQGLITRSRETNDRRVVTTRITERGREILAELDAPVVLLHKRQFGHLGEEKLHQLLTLLEEVSSRSEAQA